MKKIIKPLQEEEAEIYCDFSGERFVNDVPEVEVQLEFNYGTTFDCARLNLEIKETEFKEVLELIKSKLSDKSKEVLRERLYRINNRYWESVDARSYDESDHFASQKNFIEFLLK